MPDDNETKGIFLNAAVKPLEERVVPPSVVQMVEAAGAEIVGYHDACQIYARTKAEGGINAQPPTVEGFIVRPRSKQADK